MENQRNLILAVVFSMAVLLIFDFFFNPKTNVSNISDSSISDDTVEAELLPKIGKGVETLSQKVNLKEKRINFDMNRIKGSINLYGATIDDVILKDYKESIKKDSNNIQVLGKEGSETPYLVRSGWASNSEFSFPNKETLWNSKKNSFKLFTKMIFDKRLKEFKYPYYFIFYFFRYLIKTK